jgi:hypothetical protein
MSQGPRIASAAALALALLAAAPAQEPKEARPAEARPQDTTLFNALRDVINRGADLYNGGDPAACYRLFEGSLMSVRPLLDHRPEVQKAITRGLASAERDPFTWRRAFTLRSVLDKVRAELNPNRKEVDKDKLARPKPEVPKKEEKKDEEKKDEDKKAEDKKVDKEKKDDNKDD